MKKLLVAATLLLAFRASAQDIAPIPVVNADGPLEVSTEADSTIRALGFVCAFTNGILTASVSPNAPFGKRFIIDFVSMTAQVPVLTGAFAEMRTEKNNVLGARYLLNLVSQPMVFGKKAFVVSQSYRAPIESGTGINIYLLLDGSTSGATCSGTIVGHYATAPIDLIQIGGQ